MWGPRSAMFLGLVCMAGCDHPDVVFWGQGAVGDGVNPPVVGGSSAALMTDTAVHSAEDTASLRFDGSAGSFDLSFTQVRDLGDYDDGAIRFNAQSTCLGTGLFVRVLDTRTYNLSARLDNIGFVPDATSFRGVVVPIPSMIESAPGSPTDLAMIIRLSFEIGAAGGCTLWVDNIRWTAD